MDGIISRATQSPGLDTAVLLTDAGAFGGAASVPGQVRPTVSPLTRVGGLTLFQRAVLTLQRAGVSQVLVLAGEEEEALRRLVSDDPRVSVPVRWLPVREFPPEDPRTWQALSEEVRGPCLVVGAHTVFSLELVERLKQEAREGQAAIVVSRSEDPRARPHADGLAADLVVLPAGRFGAALPHGKAPQRAMPLRAYIEQAVADGGVRTIAVPPHWCLDVRDQAGAKTAERTLLQALTSELDGFVDRYFNRKLSGVFTRWFLSAGLAPNAITVVSMLIGVVAAASFALGGYAAGLIGALLFQLSAIVDCCDGEVARLTFAESRLGEQLDIVADNLVHMAIFAGIAWGVFLKHGGTQGSWLPLGLGASAIVANGLALWLVTRARRLKGQGAWADPVRATPSDFLLKHVVSRDFSVVVLFFALFDRLEWFLWLAALGSTVFCIVMAWVTRPSTVARA